MVIVPLLNARQARNGCDVSSTLLFFSSECEIPLNIFCNVVYDHGVELRCTPNFMKSNYLWRLADKSSGKEFHKRSYFEISCSKHIPKVVVGRERGWRMMAVTKRGEGQWLLYYFFRFSFPSRSRGRIAQLAGLSTWWAYLVKRSSPPCAECAFFFFAFSWLP